MFSQFMDVPLFPIEPEPAAVPHHKNETTHQRPQKDPLGDITGSISRLFNGVLKQFSAEEFDAGDILLVLIILFLFLEGDNLELVITLGLMLLFGLSGD